MNLCERVAEASSSRSANISSLEKEKPYFVIEKERVQTVGYLYSLLSRRLPQTSCAYYFPYVSHLSFRTLIQI
jgi:hypothetical protein